MNKEKIFRELYEGSVKRDEWFDKLPRDINTAFIDNGYVNNLLMERDMLMSIVMGEHLEAVEWFLYEWRPGMVVGANGVTTKIHNIDEYIDWMKKNEGFE